VNKHSNSINTAERVPSAVFDFRYFKDYYSIMALYSYGSSIKISLNEL